MTSEEYKELNIYLNETFIYLDYNFETLIDNIMHIFILNDKYKVLVQKYDLELEHKENNLTFEDVYLLARKIIEKINKEYLKDYDNLIKSGELDFSYEGEYPDSNFTHSPYYNLVNINRGFNYSDVVTLIHEYFHYTNGKNGSSNNHLLLTEFLSIYFELYAIDYLIGSGVPQEETDYFLRIVSTYKRTQNIYYIETPLLAYSKFGTVDETSYKLLCDFFSLALTKEQFDYECKTLLNWFRSVEKEYHNKRFKDEYDEYDLRQYYGEMFKEYFLYFVGTVLAFYAKENCDINDIIYMNDHINDEGLSFSDCLRKMKINVNDPEFDDKALKSIEKYLDQFKAKKRVNHV